MADLPYLIKTTTLPVVLALVSRQSSLSCETKLLARLWKDLVFTAAGASVDLSSPLFQRNDLLPYLGGIVRVWGKSEIGLPVRSTQTDLKVLSS